MSSSVVDTSIVAFLNWARPGTQSFDEFWAWANSKADPRVQSWPLLDNIAPTLYITAAYLVFVILSPLFKNFYRPFQLKTLMILYNALVIGINVYMLQGFVLEAYRNRYMPICNPIDLSPKGTMTAWYIYVYYLSKVVDFMDTVIIVLRQKFDQLSFLHVYHHSAMFFIWWIGSKWGNGGDAIFGPMCNSFIHIVMYTYYLGSALKINIPGKKYLTMMQMAQFFIVVTHSALIIILDCPFPHVFEYAQVIFLCTLFALFLNFYVKAYHGTKRRVRDAPHSASGASGASPQSGRRRAAPKEE
ncbi:long chain fatty acid elongation (GNS1/SUR4) family protein, putative [Bodo saltans]|uniref:Elongation of fatty acids protein n=1 Tax=Bodo saltans TaxID=75058 RepID=A0A0S4JH58_BODSA|nr:long chain fatty acid elongation (GNS1/SUR4) family protein, putative [Bodo saltans]|eukprot:CUG90826.1 long chain fatty acid elongation (GNS1/SUR4) family protein, putative [Bodo saltans]